MTAWRPHRRGLLRAGLGAAAAALLLAPAGATKDGRLPADLSFEVLRKGARIGTHQVRFRRSDGGGLAVATVVDIAVKIAFVTAFRFRQEADERWRDGRLVASDIATVEDGEASRVRVAEEGGRLRVEGPRGSYAVDADTMTDVSLWNEAVTRGTRLIDGHHGELMPIRVGPPADEEVEVAGRKVPARRYDLVASQTREGTAREGTLWYDRDDRWVRTTYLTRGERLTLRLTTG